MFSLIYLFHAGLWLSWKVIGERKIYTATPAKMQFLKKMGNIRTKKS